MAKTSVIQALRQCEGVLLDELEQRQMAGMPEYEKPVRTALNASTRAIQTALEAATTWKKLRKDLLTAAKAVFDYDDTHGYGADDEGYNKLAELREAIEAIKGKH